MKIINFHHPRFKLLRVPQPVTRNPQPMGKAKALTDESAKSDERLVNLMHLLFDVF